MKSKSIIISIMIGIMLLSFNNCAKKVKPLNEQLDDLEKIIVKYEPEFQNTEYGSKAYSEMVALYNKEIKDWAEIFEGNRYTKDSNGSIVSNTEFKKVEKRFYELNNRMTRMVLSTIPKKEKPIEGETHE